MTVADYAFPPHPSPTALRAAGVTGVCRYLSWLPNPKVVTKGEYDALHNAGIDVVLNWEYQAKDWLAGPAAGKNHATEAVRQARVLGYPTGCAILGSADIDMTRGQWDAAAHGYAAAFGGTLRAAGYRAGVYGPWDVLTWCRDAGLADVYWQAGMSTAWSGGRNRNLWPGAHLRQRRQTRIGGASVDLNDAVQTDYGQHPATGTGDDMYEQYDRDLLSFTKGTVEGTAKQVATLGEALAKVAEKIDLDPAELAAIQQAAQAGTAAAIGVSAHSLAIEIAAALRDTASAVDAATVEAAVRRVFADAASPDTAPQG